MTTKAHRPPLLVYCAASVEPAVAPAAAAFERETGRSVTLECGPSGKLLERLKRERNGDLFIPAAVEPYLNRCRKDGTIGDVIPLASLQLVLAAGPSGSSAPLSLAELVAGRRRYAIAHEEAAAGLATLEALAPVIDWPQFAQGATAICPTVTDVAAAIRDGNDVDCGIVWDATARQFALTIVEVPELSTARVEIGAGALAASRDLLSAQKFAEYLAAGDQGGTYFKLLGYSASGS